MRLQYAKIKNFKGIEEWEINFKPGFNLIKGENGRGKTSLLEALAVGLGGFIAGIEGVATRHFSKDEIRQVYSVLGDGAYNKKHVVPIEVSLQSVKAARSTTQPREICKKAERLTEQDTTELPIISYLGAGRVWSQKKEKSEDVFRSSYFRTVGYLDALAEASNIKLLLNWCAKMEQLEWKKGRKISEYEAVKQAVADFMSYMEQETIYEVFYEKQQEELMLQKEGRIIPIRTLSAGYQSLIWMVLDIAYRMAVLNPYKKTAITETSGIILIDELDMHLHPRWQWNIIEALRRVFPNIQFIAATHSPILFASAKNVWLIDVEKETIQYGYSHYGIDINTSVNRYQETQEMPKEIKGKADLFCDAMDQEDYEKARLILEELETKTAPVHPLLLQLRTRYEMETILLQERADY